MPGMLMMLAATLLLLLASAVADVHTEIQMGGTDFKLDITSARAKEVSHVVLVDRNSEIQRFSLLWQWSDDKSTTAFSYNHDSGCSYDNGCYFVDIPNYGNSGDYNYTITSTVSVTNDTTIKNDEYTGTLTLGDPVTISYAVSMGVTFAVIYVGIALLLVFRNKVPCVIRQRQRIDKYQEERARLDKPDEISAISTSSDSRREDNNQGKSSSSLSAPSNHSDKE